MPPDLRHKTYDTSNSAIIIEDRAGWAISLLKLAGLIEYPVKKTCEATPFGHKMYDKHGMKLDAKILRAQPKFVEHKKILAERKERNNTTLVLDEEAIDFFENIEETIYAQVRNYNQVMATELLGRIIQSTPIFFEHLVKDLLVAMGYKGEHGTAIVTKASRDGGIDGIINQDPLGTSTVYFQAKKYKLDNSVQRQDIETFYGALAQIRANRGVFITTSRFSKAAEKVAQQFSIVLIDGITLTDLMLEYTVGVKPKKPYILYDIDEDFFEEY